MSAEQDMDDEMRVEVILHDVLCKTLGASLATVAARQRAAILSSEWLAELRQERGRADEASHAAGRHKSDAAYWENEYETAEDMKTELRAALSRAEETIDRINALLAPVLERVDREQIGTHGPECHTRHLGCLALAIEWALTGALAIEGVVNVPADVEIRTCSSSGGPEPLEGT